MSKKKKEIRRKKSEGEEWLDYLTEDMDNEVDVGTGFRAVGRTLVFIIWIWIKIIRGVYNMVFRRKKNKENEGKDVILPSPQQSVPPLQPAKSQLIQPQPAQQPVPPVPQQPQPVLQIPAPVPVVGAEPQAVPPLPPTPTAPPTDTLFTQMNDALNEITSDVNEAFKSVSEEIKDIRAEIEKLYKMIGVKTGVQPPSQERILFRK